MKKKVEDNKSTMVSLEISEDLNERIYAVLDDLGGISRSAFIRQAIMEKLEKKA